MNMILNRSQAEAVYSAMCALNNISARMEACVDGAFHVCEVSDGSIVVHKLPPSFANAYVGPEIHVNQAAFAIVYGLHLAHPSLETPARVF